MAQADWSGSVRSAQGLRATMTMPVLSALPEIMAQPMTDMVLLTPGIWRTSLSKRLMKSSVTARLVPSRRATSTKTTPWSSSGRKEVGVML